MSYLDAREEAKRKIEKHKRDANITPMVSCSGMTKYVDYLSAAHNVSSTADVTLLNGVAAGSDFYQRIGRTIVSKEIKLRIAFSMVSTPTGWYSHDSARVIILWDNQGGATPTASDVLLDVNASNVSQTNSLSGKNINNKERFIFLVDRNFHLPSFTVTTIGQIASTNTTHAPNNDIWGCDINVNLDGLVTKFNSVNAASTDISNGALYMFILGSALAASSGWRLVTTSRYSFYDC